MNGFYFVCKELHEQFNFINKSNCPNWISNGEKNRKKIKHAKWKILHQTIRHLVKLLLKHIFIRKVFELIKFF